VTEDPATRKATAIDVIAEISVTPQATIFYHPWQSWGICGRTPFGQGSPIPRNDHNRAHFYRDDAPYPDPGVPGVPGIVQSDGGLLAIDPGAGGDIIVFSAPSPADVPVIRAIPQGHRHLEISASGPCMRRTFPGALDDALEAWAASWLPTLPVRTPGDHDHPAPPTAWNTWYSYKRRFDLGNLDQTMDLLSEHDLDCQVIQIDDGYFTNLGDWLTIVPALGGSIKALADRIRDRGHDFGLWVCPTLADVNSDIVARRPELWVPDRTAPFGSARTVRVLDPSAPGAADYVAELFGELVQAGMSWCKMDFLWTGCLTGLRHDGADPISAYRQTLRMIRAAVGPEVTLIGCGAPMLASVDAGLDAVRTTPDVSRTWEPADGDLTQPSGRSSVHTGRERAFLHPHLLRADPDVSLLAPDVENREQILRHVASQPGSLRVCGDRLPDLIEDPWALDMTRRVLAGEIIT
jgi:alpha-galactosidase